jgi:hypothetical protein
MTDPYASSFGQSSPKPPLPSPGLSQVGYGDRNPHESWQSMQGTNGQQQQMSAVGEGHGLVSPGMISPGHVTGLSPWGPQGFAPQQGRYSPVPQQQLPEEMATGREEQIVSPGGSPGLPGRDSYQAHLSQPSLAGVASGTYDGTETGTGVGTYASAQPSATLSGPHELTAGPHEMDATRDGEPHVMSPPPEYVGRSFSFAQGAPAEQPGIEKLLRDPERDG